MQKTGHRRFSRGIANFIATFFTCFCVVIIFSVSFSEWIKSFFFSSTTDGRIPCWIRSWRRCRVSLRGYRCSRFWRCWLWWSSGFKGRAALLVLALVVGMNDGVISQAIKKTVNRPRPMEALAGVRVVKLRDTSPRFLAVFKPARVGISLPEQGEITGRSFPPRIR